MSLLIDYENPDISVLVDDSYDYRQDGGQRDKQGKGNQNKQGQGNQNKQGQGNQNKQGQGNQNKQGQGQGSNRPRLATSDCFNKIKSEGKLEEFKKENTEGQKKIIKEVCGEEGFDKRNKNSKSGNSQKDKGTFVSLFVDTPNNRYDAKKISVRALVDMKQGDYVRLNKKRLQWTSFAVIVILVGMIITDSFDHANKEKVKNPATRWIGIIITTVGWGLLTVEFIWTNRSRRFKIQVGLACFFIWLSYVLTKYFEGEDKIPNPAITVINGLAWAVLAFLMTSTLVGYERGLWIPILVSMLVSLYLLLPIQRKFCVVDGPSYPIQILGGWIPLIYANAMRA